MTGSLSCRITEVVEELLGEVLVRKVAVLSEEAGGDIIILTNSGDCHQYK